jgi:hypothetical protein
VKREGRHQNPQQEMTPAVVACSMLAGRALVGPLTGVMCDVSQAPSPCWHPTTRAAYVRLFAHRVGVRSLLALLPSWLMLLLLLLLLLPRLQCGAAVAGWLHDLTATMFLPRVQENAHAHETHVHARLLSSTRLLPACAPPSCQCLAFCCHPATTCTRVALQGTVLKAATAICMGHGP